jgi:hypothetical protein
MKRRLCVLLLSGMCAFSLLPSTNGCESFYAGPFIVTLPWQLGQFLHLGLVET